MARDGDGESWDEGSEEEADPDFDRLLERVAAVPAGEAIMGRIIVPGSTLCDGRFLVQRRLGEGGMGVVFEVLDRIAQRPVALKTLTRLDAPGIFRLKQEFRSLVDLAHPNLIGLHELFASDDLWFFTMDRIEGVSFSEHVRPRGGLDESVLRAALGQLASGVEAIHRAGKLHRDLKPSNVLVTAEPRVVILDFGLVRDATSAAQTQTNEHAIAGTPAYMAPEQARGERASAASDWYAVGVMLFEALTGRLPFREAGLPLLLAKQTRDAPQVRSIAEHAPADLAELCDRLLACDTGARPGAREIRALAVAHAKTIAPGSTPAELPVAVESRAAPFVGRVREIAALEAALADTDAGKPVFVFVQGPSGIGKTTLAARFISAAKARGDAAVLGSRCYPRERVPFKGCDGLVDALSAYLARLGERDAASLVPRHAHALLQLFPVLGRVEALSAAPLRRPLTADPAELRFQAFDGLKELLARLAERRPLIVWIDDLQWSDGDSARLLAHVLAPPDPPALLVIATVRDEEPNSDGLAALRAALAATGRIDVRTLPVPALTRGEALRLAEQLAPDAEPERLRRLSAAGGGSPFLVSELAYAARAGDEHADLERAVLDRVALLTAVDRAVLQAICVASRPVEVPLLDRIVAADIGASLRLLSAGRLCREVAGPSDVPSAAAYHDRIREAVLAAMAPAELADWHARFAARMAEAETPDLEVLADHHFAAGDTQRGAQCALRAARAAAELMAFDRAVQLFERALAHLALAGAARAEVLVELADVLIGAGRCADAAHRFTAAAVADPTRAEELQRRAGEQFMFAGHLETGMSAIRLALRASGIDFDALLAESPLPRYQRLLARGFGFEARAEGELDPARLARHDTLWCAASTTIQYRFESGLSVACLEDALDLGEPFRVARTRGMLRALDQVVDPDQAPARAAEVVDLCSAIGTPPALALAEMCSAASGWTTGSRDLGVPQLLRAHELLAASECSGMNRERSMARSQLTVLRLWLDPAAASADVVGFLREADQRGDRYNAVYLRTVGYRCRVLDEEAARVRSEIERGREMSAGLPAGQLHGSALLSLAFVDAWEGRFDDLLERTTRAFSGLSPLGIHNLLPRAGRCTMLLAAARVASDRGALLARVEKDIEVIARPLGARGRPLHFPFFDGWPEYLRAQVAAARGDRDRAFALLEDAQARADRDSLLAIHVQKRRGVVRGGAEGARLVDRAAAELTARRIRDPERWFALYAPDFEG